MHARHDITPILLQTVITLSLRHEVNKSTRGWLPNHCYLRHHETPLHRLRGPALHRSIVSPPALWARSSDWPLIISSSGWLQRVAGGGHGAAMTSDYVVQAYGLRGEGNRPC